MNSWPRFSLIVFLTVFGAMADARAQESGTEIARLIDTYIDQRFDGDSSSTKELIHKLNQAGVTRMEDFEKALRARRANYPDTTEWMGKVTIHNIECLHVDYETRYLMFAPAELDADKPVSLVIVGHGGNSSMSPRRAEGTAGAYIQAYRSLAAPLNAVLVAPASSRGWGQIGNSLIFSTVSDVQRKFPIDPDRIYITGQSMGGHLSYRSALSFPDRFGAVSPHSGGYDYVEKKAIGNLLNVPGYAVWGVREPYGINKDNRTNSVWAKTRGLKWTFVEKDGGHEIYQDELPNVAKFFNENPRDLYRKQVYLRQGGAMKFVKTWQIKGWPEHTIYHESKPLRWNMRHWLQVEPRPDLGEPLTVLARKTGQNKFEIASRNVRQLSVFLHPDQVDLQQPVAVSINGDELFNSVVETSPALMFDLAREFDDRGRVFWARIDLEVTTDQDIEIPETKQ